MINQKDIEAAAQDYAIEAIDAEDFGPSHYDAFIAGAQWAQEKMLAGMGELIDKQTAALKEFLFESNYEEKYAPH